jgi:uncharacterized membrane protein
MIVVAVFTAWSMWRYVGWQNDARVLLGEDPGSPTAWITIVPVTVVFTMALIGVVACIRAEAPPGQVRAACRVATSTLDAHHPAAQH